MQLWLLLDGCSQSFYPIFPSLRDYKISKSTIMLTKLYKIICADPTNVKLLSFFRSPKNTFADRKLAQIVCIWIGPCHFWTMANVFGLWPMYLGWGICCFRIWAELVCSYESREKPMFFSYDPAYQCYSSARLTWWIYMCHLVLASLILLGTSLTEDLAS